MSGPSNENTDTGTPPDRSTADTPGPANTWSFFARQRDQLVRLAYRLTWNQADAEEAVHNAMLLAVERQNQLSRSDRLGAWVRTIVVRQCHQITRRLARSRKIEDRLIRQAQSAAPNDTDSRAAAPPANAPSDTAELAGIIRILLADLPDRQRTAFVLRHLEQLDYATIAEIMEINASTARVHVTEARKCLRRWIEERYPDWADEQ